MQAVVITVGDELVLGQTTDTNSAYLSAQLAELGILTRYHQSVGDDRAAIAQAIRQAAEEAELVILTGGLGPTKDDLTRQALAEVLGVELVEDAEALEQIRRFFAQRGREMPASNRVQALIPRGAEAIANPCGTAPGIRVQLGRTRLYALPGVPQEVVEMFQRHLRGELERWSAEEGRGRQVILTRTIHSFGLGESQVGQILGPLMERGRNPTVGTTVAGGVVSVRVRSVFEDPVRAKEELDQTVRQIEELLQPFVYGCDQETLEGVVIEELRRRGLKLASAESCTGGGLGAALTRVPGASQVYLGGWVAYANAMKVRELGVSAGLIERRGAVSGPVACAMAAGALKEAGADVAVSLTGIAGPEGGSPQKPVGTVWVGLAWRKSLNNSGLSVQAWEMRFGNPGRTMIQERAVKAALQILRFGLLGLPVSKIQWVVRKCAFVKGSKGEA